MSGNDPKIEVDFSHQDTEAGWNRILYEFGKRAAPVWFNWLGWFLLLGALQYLFKKSQSILAGITIGISVGFLWLYFQAFFYNIRFLNVPLFRRVKNKGLYLLSFQGFWRTCFGKQQCGPQMLF